MAAEKSARTPTSSAGAFFCAPSLLPVMPLSFSRSRSLRSVSVPIYAHMTHSAHQHGTAQAEHVKVDQHESGTSSSGMGRPSARWMRARTSTTCLGTTHFLH